MPHLAHCILVNLPHHENETIFFVVIKWPFTNFHWLLAYQGNCFLAKLNDHENETILILDRNIEGILKFMISRNNAQRQLLSREFFRRYRRVCIFSVTRQFTNRTQLTFFGVLCSGQGRRKHYKNGMAHWLKGTLAGFLEVRLCTLSEG